MIVKNSLLPNSRFHSTGDTHDGRQKRKPEQRARFINTSRKFSGNKSEWDCSACKCDRKLWRSLNQCFRFFFLFPNMFDYSLQAASSPTQSFSSLLPKALSAVLHTKVPPGLNSDPEPSRSPVSPPNLEQLQTELRDLRGQFDQMKSQHK